MVALLVGSILLGYVFGWLVQFRYRKRTYAIATQIRARMKILALHKSQDNRQKLEEELRELTTFMEQSLQETHKRRESTQRRLANREAKLQSRSQNLNSHIESLRNYQVALQNLQRVIHDEQQRWKKCQLQYSQKLLRRGGFQHREIHSEILQSLAKDVVRAQRRLVKKRTKSIESDLRNLAFRALEATVQRCAMSHWANNSTNTLLLENFSFDEQMLLSLEKLLAEKLGVTLAFEKQDKTISINDSDGVNREIAKRMIIEVVENASSESEETVEKFSVELANELLEAGREVSHMARIDDFPEEILLLLGRLQYRTSFGQNVLWHSLEVARLASLLAAENGLDHRKAMRAGLLHDIGKALDHEKEGGHAEIGEKILDRLKESAEVIEGVVKHHDDVQPDLPYAALVNIADAISASRPGARRETFEKYVKRLEQLESIAYSIPGIENAYAVSAGREIRVLVDPVKVSREDAPTVAKNIVHSIKNKFQYPGTVKVTLIREIEVVKSCR